jgi:hypothetical protein
MLRVVTVRQLGESYQPMLTWGSVEAQALRKRGWSVSAIARQLGRDRKTSSAMTGRTRRSPGRCGLGADLARVGVIIRKPAVAGEVAEMGQGDERGQVCGHVTGAAGRRGDEIAAARTSQLGQEPRARRRP